MSSIDRNWSTVRVVPDRDGGSAELVIDRPPVNAVNLQMIDDLMEAIDHVAAHTEIRALVIRGEGRCFLAGADLAMLGDLSRQNHVRARRFVDVQRLIEGLPIPVLAAIHGSAFGGGLELAMACDYRYATESTRLGLTEMRFGLLPGAGGTQRLRRLLGPDRAFKFIVAADQVAAAEAVELGIIDRVVGDDDLKQVTSEWKAEMLTKPTVAVGLLKRVLKQSYGQTMEDGLALEEQAVYEVIETEDVRQGIDAFFAKRNPVFKGR